MAVLLISPLPEHAELWWQWRTDKGARTFMPLEASSPDELAKRITRSSPDLSDRSATEYRWMVESDDQVVGTVAALKPSWKMGCAEISYHIGVEFQRRGIGSKAVAQLIERLLSQPQLHHIFATVSHENCPSCRLLNRLGFVVEGVMREHFFINGKYVDQCLYGLLRDEWRSYGR